MELTTIQNTQTTRLGTGYEGDVSQGTAAADAKPILAGSGVTVTQTSDYEKLLAQLKEENEEQKRKTLVSSFASALASLDSRYASISSTQSAAIKNASEKATAAEKAAQGVETAQLAYDESVSDLSELKEQLENQVKTEKAAEEAAKKAAEEAAKKAAEEAAKKQETSGTKETAKTGETTETKETAKTETPVAAATPAAPKEDSAEVKKIKEAIAKQEAVVNEKKAALDTAMADSTAAEAALKTALAALDKTTLLIVTDAVRNAAKTIAAAAAEQPEGKEREQEASAIVQALGEYADKLQEMQDEELEEMIAKVSTDILFLARADLTVDPADLPEYEPKV